MLAISMVASGEEGIIFEMRDPVGDEYGPGSYTYPKSEQFAPYEGLFDLVHYKVEEDGDNYNFYFKFVEITNPWHAPYGFSHQLIQVYIDNDEGGSLETFKPGANVRFEKSHPWNKLIKLTGWTLEVFDYRDDVKANKRLTENKVEVLAEGKTIKVSIPRAKLGDLEKAKYYVLIGSLDGFAYDNYREVVQEAQGWKFGGNNNPDIMPHVIDILVPQGMDQKDILGSYNLETGEFATLRAVGPELGLHWKFIIIFGFLALLVASLIGAVVKFLFKNFDN